MISRKRNNDLHQIWSKTLTYTAWQAGAPSLSTQFRATITIIQSPLSPTGGQTHQHSEKALASNAATNSRCNRNTINYHPKTTATALAAASSLDSGSKGFCIVRPFVYTRSLRNHRRWLSQWRRLRLRTAGVSSRLAWYFCGFVLRVFASNALAATSSSSGLVVVVLGGFTGQFNQIKNPKTIEPFFLRRKVFFRFSHRNQILEKSHTATRKKIKAKQVLERYRR